MYRLRDDFQAGVEYNPLDDDVGLLANWRVVDETQERPAVVLGTSSDRIGTPRGRAVYVTLSKDLERWTGLPVAPYVGTSYSGFDDEFLPVGGLSIRWAERFSTTHLYDGDNLHHLGTYRLEGGASVGLLLVQQDEDYYLGASAGFAFGYRGDDP